MYTIFKTYPIYIYKYQYKERRHPKYNRKMKHVVYEIPTTIRVEIGFWLQIC